MKADGYGITHEQNGLSGEKYANIELRPKKLSNDRFWVSGLLWKHFSAIIHRLIPISQNKRRKAIDTFQCVWTKLSVLQQKYSVESITINHNSSFN